MFLSGCGQTFVLTIIGFGEGGESLFGPGDESGWLGPNTHDADVALPPSSYVSCASHITGKYALRKDAL